GGGQFRPRPRPAAAVLHRRAEPAVDRGPGGADAAGAGRPPGRADPVRGKTARARPAATGRVLPRRRRRARGGRPPPPFGPERLQLAAAHPQGPVRVYPPHVGPENPTGVAAMSAPDDLHDLFDDYLSDTLDEVRWRQLEDRL